MRIPILALGATMASALALSTAANAQQDDTQPQAGQAAQSQCSESLDALAQRMNDDGYWLSGYTGYGVGSFGVGRADGTMGGTAGTAGTAAPATRPANDPAAQTGPWANVTWEERPHYEIRTLFRAANVLAANGDEEACMTVASAAEQRYEGYVGQLEELGVEPQEIADWRQAAIAQAVPVTETSFPQRAETLIGADVRGTGDEDLGDISDVVLDPRNGGVQYAVVSTGGFFGIGSEEVAVPWEHLWVAPGMSTFVLPVDQAAMQEAPRVAQEDLVDQGQTGAIQDEVDSYWSDAVEQ